MKTDEFGNDEHAIRLVAIAAHARGDYEAERIALDRLALMEHAESLHTRRNQFITESSAEFADADADEVTELLAEAKRKRTYPT